MGCFGGSGKADAYVISWAKRQAPSRKRAWLLRIRQLTSGVAFFQCILLKTFIINDLRTGLHVLTRLYPQNLWATHP
jgi:hypothetical protein